MVRKIAFFIGSVLLLLIVSVHASEAQCAMCRVTVENNVSNGEDSVAAGLNTGILMLLAMPYAAFIVITYFWYRTSRKEHGKRFKMASYIRGKVSPM